MLLYTYYISIFEEENIDIVLNPKFHREFIDKCFFCGCLPDQSGVAISYFVVQRISFVLFAQKLRGESQTSESKTDKNKTEQIFKYLLSALVNALQPHEGILIYDDIRNRCINLPQRETDLSNFISSYIFNKWAIYNFFRNDKKLSEKSEDLSKIYNALQAKFKGFVINVYYTLIDNTIPVLPKNISANFFFCQKSYRKQYASCRTKTYVRTDLSSPDELFKGIYDFVGLKQTMK